MLTDSDFADVTNNLRLKEILSQLHDDTLLDTIEVSIFIGYSTSAVRQKKIMGLPLPMPDLSLARWRIGDLREWVRGAQKVAVSAGTSARTKSYFGQIGRPTKADSIARRHLAVSETRTSGSQ